MFADCWHPAINGVVTSLDILCARLERLGHEVELFVPAWPNTPPDPPRVHRFVSLCLPSIHRESRFSLPLPWSNMRRLAQVRPDVIHVHTPFNLGQLGTWAARRLGIPYVFTHHTLWEKYVHYVPLLSRRLLQAAAISLCRRMCNRAALVITPSHEVCDRLRTQGVVRPIEVIPTGIDTAVFQGGEPDRVRGALGIPPGEPVALYAGRLAREKSVDVLLHAFAEVVRSVPRAHLVVVGGGPEQEMLERLSQRLGLRDTNSVHFTGYQPRPELVHYFKMARVFMFASTTETQGLVSLEAQAAGCPVVAVRASGSSEAVLHGKTGFLVPNEVSALATSTRRLLVDDSLQQAMAECAEQWAWSASSLEMASRTLAVYTRAVARTPSAEAAWARLPGLRRVRR